MCDLLLFYVRFALACTYLLLLNVYCHFIKKIRVYLLNIRLQRDRKSVTVVSLTFSPT